MGRESLQADKRKRGCKEWDWGRMEYSRSDKGGFGGSRPYRGERMGGGEGGEVGWGLEGQAEEFGLYPGGSESHGRIFERG